MNINDAFYILQQCNSVTQGGEVAEALNVVEKEYLRLITIEEAYRDWREEYKDCLTVEQVEAVAVIREGQHDTRYCKLCGGGETYYFPFAHAPDCILYEKEVNDANPPD